MHLYRINTLTDRQKIFLFHAMQVFNILYADVYKTPSKSYKFFRVYYNMTDRYSLFCK